MGCADDCGLMVGEKHWRAVGRQNAEQQVRPIGDHGVCARPLVLGPRCVGHDHLGRMDLMDRRQLRIGQQGRYREAAVAGNRVAIVAAAVADVEASALANRDTAAAAEESVRELAEADGANDLNAVHSGFRMMMSSSA
jgi:hypothetical protein